MDPRVRPFAPFSGVVPSEDLKRAAAKIARDQENVVDVINEIEIDPMAGKDPAEYAMPRKLVQG